MRPRFVVGLLLLALLVLGGALFLKQHLGNVAPAAPEMASAPAVITNTVTSLPPPAEPPPIPAAPVVTNAPTDDERQAAIEAETDRLQQWSMNDDPASLSNILADLTSSDKEIRDAAIDAVKQFGSPDAIPTLKAVAAETADTEEQIALLEAANFLSLPSADFTKPEVPPPTPEQIEAAKQNPAATGSHRHGQIPGNAPNPGPQSPAGQN